jgi:hypothetical protein
MAKYRLHLLYDYVFPNLKLPNASITEFGIINYLHTLYSNRLQDQSFFDFTEQNKNQILFDNNLGEWPNSVGGSTHLTSSSCKEIVECIEDSVFFGKKYLKKYIYPIKVSPHIDKFIGVNLKKGNKLNGEYFWKHISEEVLQDSKKGKALIFLDYLQENFINREDFDNLHTALKFSNIPKEQIVLSLNSFNAQEVYESWYSAEERRLEVRNCPFVISEISKHYANNPNIRLTTEGFLRTRNKIRNHYFIFKVRNNRQHRLELLFHLVSNDLLEKADWSCLTKITYNDQEIDHINKKYDFAFNLEKIKKLFTKIPKTLKYERSLNYNKINPWTDTILETYRDSYFYVCSETFIHGEYKSLTEKIFKPIANFQPFLFLSYPGALDLLRKLGFKTFEPFIDESYDLEKDEQKRLKLVYQEIIKLCSMSKEEIHNWFWSMEDILIHNHNHLMSIYHNEPMRINLINYLYTRTNSNEL